MDRGIRRNIIVSRMETLGKMFDEDDMPKDFSRRICRLHLQYLWLEYHIEQNRRYEDRIYIRPIEFFKMYWTIFFGTGELAEDLRKCRVEGKRRSANRRPHMTKEERISELFKIGFLEDDRLSTDDFEGELSLESRWNLFWIWREGAWLGWKIEKNSEEAGKDYIMWKEIPKIYILSALRITPYEEDYYKYVYAMADLDRIGKDESDKCNKWDKWKIWKRWKK